MHVSMRWDQPFSRMAKIVLKPVDSNPEELEVPSVAQRMSETKRGNTDSV